MQTDFKRAFIHELGHFIAAELNYILFQYDRRINKFEIEPRPNSSFCNGKVSTNKTTIGTYNPLNTAKEYAQTFYGCLFESIYRSTAIELCLNYSVGMKKHLNKNIGNGAIDDYYLLEIGLRSEISHLRFKWYDYATIDYFQYLSEKTDHMSLLFALDPNKFIAVRNNDKTIFDISKLQKETLDFILSHQGYYKSFIEGLESIK